MADIQLRSFQQILGQMISRLLATTDLNDVSPGSIFLTLMEAAAASDFTQEGKLLQLLNLRNPDKASGVDLENLATEMGVTPSRIGAQSSSVNLTISDSEFSKISTVVFAGAVSPAAGDLALKVVDGNEFPAAGTIFIGRGTSTSEAISYISIVDNTTFWSLNLSGPLTKDHLVGEEVVLSQGGDRSILAGAVARVPASAGNPAIEFRVLTDTILADGENTVPNVAAVGVNPGSNGNVGVGKIIEFASPPFSSAIVTNPDSATGGTDTETDPELRQRIKDHVHSLGRGTERAIIREVIGVSDEAQGNRVVSAFLREPTSVGALGILFIDDGTGFSPTFAGVGEEVIVTSAAGTEQFFQLQQFPLVKSQAVSIGTEPFALTGGERILFEVDGQTEERAIPGNLYRSPGVVLAQEIAEAINRTFTTVEARAKDGRLFVVPVVDDPDYIRIGAASTDDANEVIRFPVIKQFTIRLYDNDVLLEKNGFMASIQSFPNTQWPPFGSSETLQLKIDGINSPLITVTDADFALLTSSPIILGASPSDWAIVLNSKLIGITATGRDDGTFIISSNSGFSINASVAVLAGTLSGTLISATASASGQGPQFLLNRLLGQIELINRLEPGDQLKAGTTLTAGFVKTVVQAAFNLDTILTSPAQIVLVAEASTLNVLVNQTISSLTFTAPNATTQRIAGAVGQFSNVLIDDWVFLYNLTRKGLLRVKSVAGNGASVDCFDPNPQAGSSLPDGVNRQIIFFRTSGLPQTVTLPVGTNVSGSDIAFTINQQVVGVEAVVLDSGQLQISTLRLDGTGALGVPVIAGNATNLGILPGSYASNDPHIASIESSDLAGLPSGRLTVATADLVAPYDNYIANGTPFSNYTYNNRPLYDYLGATARLIREPVEALSTSQLLLREDPPLQNMEIGQDVRSTTTCGVEMSESDNMVFILDDDATRKTFDVPMYVDATVAGPTVPSNFEFDAEDAVGDLLGSSDRWLGHRFEDYRVWFRGRTDMPFSVVNSQMRITSVLFGPTGRNIRFGIFYPSVPATPSSAVFSVDAANEVILISAFLGSLAERNIGLTPGAFVYVTFTGPVSDIYTYSVRFLTPVDLSTVLPGDILSLNDPNFSPANRGQMKVATITNLSDTTRNYVHKLETLSLVTFSSFVDFALSAPPAFDLRVGDKIVVTSITKTALSTTSSTVNVVLGGAYLPGGGTFLSGLNTFSYTSYTSGSGQFAGVTPDPTALIAASDPVTQAVTPLVLGTVTIVSTPSSGTMDGSGVTTDGDGYDITLEHKTLTASAAPSFVAAIGDKIQVSGQILTITAIISSTEWDINLPFQFVGPTLGTISRLILTGTRTSAGVNETIATTSGQGVRVMELDTGNTSSSLQTTLNTTAGVNTLILASNSIGNTGAGIITTSTEDELGDGNLRVGLDNSESFIYSTLSTNPSLRLKVALDITPELGEPFKLIPMTPQNIKDHFNRKQISGLSIAARIDLVNGARHVQVSTLTPGGIGQVFAVGGKASGNNALILRSTGQQINSSVGLIQMDRAALDLIAPGHTIFIAQTGRAKKNFVGSTPISSTTAEIETVATGVGRLLFGVALASMLSYTHTGSVVWVVRQLTRNRLRFEVLSGTASIPGGLVADDYVLVGNGSSYAGTTPTQFFANANSGYFQVRETDASTYFDVDAIGAEQIITAVSAPFIFIPYHSARIGDQITINTTSPFSSNNQGTFLISAIDTVNNVRFTNPNVSDEGPFTLGSGGTDSIRVLDNGYSTYRKVSVISPNPADPTNKSLVVIEPGYNISLFNEGQGARVTFPNRLGYSSDPVPGLSGYQYWTGLKQTVQRTLDGYEPDPETFPGVRAAGVAIEAREPQIQRVTLVIKVKTKQGVALSAISDSIKSSVIGFVNSLGLGADVVLSEIVSIVQATPGVDSVVLISPTLDQERITITDSAIARTSNSELTLS